MNPIGRKIDSQARDQTFHGQIPFVLAYPYFDARFQLMEPPQDTEARILHIIGGQPSSEGMHDPPMRLGILWAHAEFDRPLLILIV